MEREPGARNANPNVEPECLAWQFNDESGAARLVVADLNRSAVFRDDAPHDGEAEAAAAPLRRIIRHEQLLPFSRRNPRSVVRDDQSDERRPRIVMSLERDDARAVHGLDG